MQVHGREWLSLAMRRRHPVVSCSKISSIRASFISPPTHAGERAISEASQRSLEYAVFIRAGTKTISPIFLFKTAPDRGGICRTNTNEYITNHWLGISETFRSITRAHGRARVRSGSRQKGNESREEYNVAPRLLSIGARLLCKQRSRAYIADSQ